MKKFFTNETLMDLFWLAFGIFSGLSYFYKSEYLISGVLFILAILYNRKLVMKWLRFSNRPPKLDKDS